MTPVGWWALDTPLELAIGHPFGGRRHQQHSIRIDTRQRTRHIYVVGSSGSGKSRWARHVLYQDIAANRGFTLVDPQDLQREILAYLARVAFGSKTPTAELLAQLGDKLVILEPADQRFGVPGINLLEVRPGQIGYQLVDAIIEIIREIWPDCFGPRLEDICRNALLLLQELRLTVLEMIPLLSDEAFRRALVARTRNPDLRLYFEGHLGGLRPAELKSWVESSRNKWSAFLSNPFIRPILGQAHSTIDFRQVIDQGKWLIVNVSRDKLKESRRLLGALIVALIHQAAIGRDQSPPNERYFHCLLVDEFQEFFTPAFLHILEGGRKYGLGLCMLHQNLNQPPFDERPAIVDTILANSHVQMAFNLSRGDAERLAGELFFPSGSRAKTQRHFLGIPIERPSFWSIGEEREHYAAELMHQRAAEAFIRVKASGAHVAGAYLANVPKVADVEPDLRAIDALKAHAARRYCRPLAHVTAEIDRRWQGLLPRGAPRPGTTDYSR